MDIKKYSFDEQFEMMKLHDDLVEHINTNQKGIFNIFDTNKHSFDINKLPDDVKSNLIEDMQKRLSKNESKYIEKIGADKFRKINEKLQLLDPKGYRGIIGGTPKVLKDDLVKLFKDFVFIDKDGSILSFKPFNKFFKELVEKNNIPKNKQDVLKDTLKSSFKFIGNVKEFIFDFLWKVFGFLMKETGYRRLSPLPVYFVNFLNRTYKNFTNNPGLYSLAKFGGELSFILPLNTAINAMIWYPNLFRLFDNENFRKKFNPDTADFGFIYTTSGPIVLLQDFLTFDVVKNILVNNVNQFCITQQSIIFKKMNKLIEKENQKIEGGENKIKLLDENQDALDCKKIVNQLKGKFKEISDELIKRIQTVKEEDCEKFTNFLIGKGYIENRDGKIEKNIEFEHIKEYYESNTELMKTIDTLNDKFKTKIASKYINIFKFLIKGGIPGEFDIFVDSGQIDSIINDFVEKKGLLTKISVESLLKDKFDGKEYKDKFNKFLEDCISIRGKREVKFAKPEKKDSTKVFEIDPETEVKFD